MAYWPPNGLAHARIMDDHGWIMVDDHYNNSPMVRSSAMTQRLQWPWRSAVTHAQPERHPPGASLQNELQAVLQTQRLQDLLTFLVLVAAVAEGNVCPAEGTRLCLKIKVKKKNDQGKIVWRPKKERSFKDQGKKDQAWNFWGVIYQVLSLKIRVNKIKVGIFEGFLPFLPGGLLIFRAPAWLFAQWAAMMSSENHL